MSRLPTSVLAALGALVLLAGCGSDDDAATTTTTSTTTEATTTVPAETVPEGTDVDEWAESFCADLDTWRADVASEVLGVEDLDPEDPEAAKATVLDALEGLQRATDTLIVATEDLDPPAVDDGEDFVAALLARFEGVAAAAASAREDVGALPTDDPAAFQAGVADAVAGVQDQVNLFATSFSSVDDTFDDPDLQAALAASCT